VVGFHRASGPFAGGVGVDVNGVQMFADVVQRGEVWEDGGADVEECADVLLAVGQFGGRRMAALLVVRLRSCIYPHGCSSGYVLLKSPAQKRSVPLVGSPASGALQATLGPKQIKTYQDP
jgi:hypothetical protein